MRWLGLLLVPVFLFSADAAAPASLERKIDGANRALREFVSGNPEDAIPDSLLRAAECVAVFPGLMKGGLILGARAGWGLGSCRTASGWSAPAFFGLAGVSIGLQAGAQRTDLVLIFTSPVARAQLSRSSLTLGAGVSLAVGPIGRDMEIDGNPKYRGAVYAYSRTRGLYAGLNLEGARLRPRASANARAWPGEDAREVLSSDFDRVMAPPRLVAFVETLEKYAPTSP